MKFALATLISALVCLLIRFLRPNGLMHIDAYVDKDMYRMLYFTPLPTLKKHKYLILKVEVKEWGTHSEDFDQEF